MGYEDLPEWVKEGEEPDAKLRDEVGAKDVYGEKKVVLASRELDKAVELKGLGKRAGGKEKSLDDWLGEEEEGSEEESSEGETETESEEGKEDEETEEEESESEEEGERDRLVGH